MSRGDNWDIKRGQWEDMKPTLEEPWIIFYHEEDGKDCNDCACSTCHNEDCDRDRCPDCEAVVSWCRYYVDYETAKFWRGEKAKEKKN